MSVCETEATLPMSCCCCCGIRGLRWNDAARDAGVGGRNLERNVGCRQSFRVCSRERRVMDRKVPGVCVSISLPNTALLCCIAFLSITALRAESSFDTAVAAAAAPISSSSSLCPLNFTVLDKFESVREQISRSDNTTFRCTSILDVLHLVLAEYVHTAGYFLVPPSSAQACWNAFDEKLSSLTAPINVTFLCNFSVSSIARGYSDCHNIQTVADFEGKVSAVSLSNINRSCNGSLQGLASCTACTTAVVVTKATDLPGQTNGSVNSCQDVVYLYTAGVVNSLGPASAGTAFCLFNIQNISRSENKHTKYIYSGAAAAVTLLLVVGIACLLYVRYKRLRIMKQKQFMEKSKTTLATSVKDASILTWFTMDEIKAATHNFSRSRIVGTGGFGNVYRGTLADGTEVAVKRFKNCSPSGDKDFFHEVEVISSVRHRNLVALQGCCVYTSSLEGHQRIILCDFMPNGSLHDHLFIKRTKFDWSTVQNIAIGMARGLAYLHHEVQPAIIHRDIKASNILLDSKWNARLADFGLAKFRPDGATHVTTRVAGTYGYVSPEYALYGQITEKSDVYSYGIVLLELLTGRKALSYSELEEPLLITDWAWPLVKKGGIADILDPAIENRGTAEVMERYVLVSLLCAHPQVPYRPSIDQVLKILENDQPLPAIPDRPIPLTSAMAEIVKVSSGSGGISSHSGFQSFSSEGSASGINMKGC
eukprot:c27429_g1_i1 orf=105-2228(+)